MFTSLVALFLRAVIHLAKLLTKLWRISGKLLTCAWNRRNSFKYTTTAKTGEALRILKKFEKNNFTKSSYDDKSHF